MLFEEFGLSITAHGCLIEILEVFLSWSVGLLFIMIVSMLVFIMAYDESAASHDETCHSANEEKDEESDEDSQLFNWLGKIINHWHRLDVDIVGQAFIDPRVNVMPKIFFLKITQGLASSHKGPPS